MHFKLVRVLVLCFALYLSLLCDDCTAYEIYFAVFYMKQSSMHEEKFSSVLLRWNIMHYYRNARLYKATNINVKRLYYYQERKENYFNGRILKNKLVST